MYRAKGYEKLLYHWIAKQNLIYIGFNKSPKEKAGNTLDDQKVTFAQILINTFTCKTEKQRLNKYLNLT